LGFVIGELIAQLGERDGPVGVEQRYQQVQQPFGLASATVRRHQWTENATAAAAIRSTTSTPPSRMNTPGPMALARQPTTTTAAASTTTTTEVTIIMGKGTPMEA